MPLLPAAYVNRLGRWGWLGFGGDEGLWKHTSSFEQGLAHMFRTIPLWRKSRECNERNNSNEQVFPSIAYLYLFDSFFLGFVRYESMLWNTQNHAEQMDQ